MTIIEKNLPNLTFSPHGHYNWIVKLTYNRVGKPVIDGQVIWINDENLEDYYVRLYQVNKFCLDKQKVKEAIEKLIHYGEFECISPVELKKELGLE